MSTLLAFFGTVLIWATTPLAIKWSGDGVSPVFGVTGRMVIGALIVLAWMLASGTRLPRHRAAVQTYVAASLGIYGAMMLVYWGAGHIPSGWISVLYGLSPIVTGLMAHTVLRERSFTPARLAGMLLGVAGLAVIFAEGHSMGQAATLGVLAVLGSTVLHGASAVWVKRIDAQLPALPTVAGGLLFALPLYLLTWALTDGALPAGLPLRAGLSIVYLGVFGSVFGFLLYFYALKRLDASRTALISLMTPVLSLHLGHLLNGEPLHARVWMGTLLILLGLALYELGAGVRLLRSALADPRTRASRLRHALAVPQPGQHAPEPDRPAP